MTASEDDWRNKAACRGADPDLWFPPQGDLGREALAICNTSCGVRQECLDENIWEPQGIFGGLTARERRWERQRRGLTKPPPPIDHGTNAGYTQHKRQGIPACPACLLAHAAAQFEAKQKRRLRLVGDVA